MEDKKTALTPVVAFTKSLGLKLEKKDTFTLHSPNKDGKITVKIENAQIAESANALEMLVNASNKSTKAICATLAYIEKLGSHAQFGFKSVADFGEALTGLDRKTVLIYIQIGRTFFNDFEVVKPFVNELSVGHLNQMRNMVADSCYVYGAKTDLGFFQALFDSIKEKDTTLPTVAGLNKILSGIRSNYIDVRYLNDKKTAFLVDDKKDRFPNYIELNEVTDDEAGDKGGDKAGDKGGDNAGDNGGETISSKDKAVSMLIDALDTFESLFPTDEKLRVKATDIKAYIAKLLDDDGKEN